MHINRHLLLVTWPSAICIALVTPYLFIHNKEWIAYCLISGLGLIVLVTAACATWFSSPESCLVSLKAMDPRRLNALNSTHRAQRCQTEVLRLLQSRCDDVKGNEHAHTAYSAGLACGFYASEQSAPRLAPLPLSSRKWKPEQLVQVREIGVQHGKLLRHQSYNSYV